MLGGSCPKPATRSPTPGPVRVTEPAGGGLPTRAGAGTTPATGTRALARTAARGRAPEGLAGAAGPPGDTRRRPRIAAVQQPPRAAVRLSPGRGVPLLQQGDAHVRRGDAGPGLPAEPVRVHGTPLRNAALPVGRRLAVARLSPVRRGVLRQPLQRLPHGARPRGRARDPRCRGRL